MKIRLFVYVALFTIFISCIFVSYNSNIAADFTEDFKEGEMFLPENNHFDFRNFSLNCSDAKNFTVKFISNGHTQFIDDTGNITVNYVEFDKMVNIEESPLQMPELKEIAPTFKWSSQASGIQIPKEIGEKLEEIWIKNVL